MMRPTFVVWLNAFCMAMALTCATTRAAEQSSLIGATRAQVVERYGEPKSQIVAGNRVVMFFARERIVLRDGVVIEVDRLPGEGPTKAPTPTPAPSTTAENQAGAPAAAERGPGAASAPGTVAPPSTPPAKSSTAATEPETTAAPPEPKFEIKRVRPSGSVPRAQPQKETPLPSNVEEPATTTASRPPQPVPPASTPAPAPGATSAPIAGSVPSAPTVTTITPPAETEGPKPEERSGEAEKAENDKKAKTAKKPAIRRVASEPDIPGTAEIISSRRNYFITFLVVASGLGYLYWRYRQRQLALEATAVSRTPFSAPAAANLGVVFNNELLQKLEWKRFEELVASYYSKTGVVAVRTKSGPAAPVHIKISWKGEPRPFAYVQCIAHPVGLIDASPLQQLVNVLAAEDIRRGYVVSTGKFGVAARDLAEEKHLTLLPGDMFLEKLNALPDAARSELMQQTTVGDYTTPSCPKCEAKMVKSPEDPTMWKCPTHPDQRMPVLG
jgi:hypothetical protein